MREKTRTSGKLGVRVWRDGMDDSPRHSDAFLILGLRVRITPPDTSWARDITTSIRRGDISQMSIGFVVEDDEWSSQDGIDTRELKKVRLFDVSPVTFPAYTATDVGVRAMQEYDVYKTEQRKVAEETENAVKKAKQQEKLKNLQAKFKII